MSGIILILILFFLVLRYKKNDRMACIKIELTER